MLEPQKTPGPGNGALNELFSVVYEELRRIASYVRKNDANATISSTALVHESWLKLRRSPSFAVESEEHFKAIAANAMRQVLVDEARRRSARKRGGAGEAVIVSLDEAEPAVACSNDELLVLDANLQELARLNSRQAQVVVNRFFGGMNVDETAGVLGVSASAVERDWRAARAWLASRVRPGRE
ncbi:MAG TPA: ECF-type sigma factor [Bryobacteraceae bacterium]|nr:ECF-type sigma factor [Bryobacteraceae bacterium]